MAAAALQEPLWTVLDLAAHFRVSRAQAYRLGARIPKATPPGMFPRWDPDTVRPATNSLPLPRDPTGPRVRS